MSVLCVLYPVPNICDDMHSDAVVRSTECEELILLSFSKSDTVSALLWDHSSIMDCFYVLIERSHVLLYKVDSSTITGSRDDASLILTSREHFFC